MTAIDVDTAQVTGKLVPANRGHIALPLRDGAEILVRRRDGVAISGLAWSATRSFAESSSAKASKP